MSLILRWYHLPDFLRSQLLFSFSDSSVSPYHTHTPTSPYQTASNWHVITKIHSWLPSNGVRSHVGRGPGALCVVYSSMGPQALVNVLTSLKSLGPNLPWVPIGSCWFCSHSLANCSTELSCQVRSLHSALGVRHGLSIHSHEDTFSCPSTISACWEIFIFERKSSCFILLHKINSSPHSLRNMIPIFSQFLRLHHQTYPMNICLDRCVTCSRPLPKPASCLGLVSGMLFKAEDRSPYLAPVTVPGS